MSSSTKWLTSKILFVNIPSIKLIYLPKISSGTHSKNAAKDNYDYGNN